MVSTGAPRDAGAPKEGAPEAAPRSVRFRGLDRILHVGDRRELDVVELASGLLDLADIDVLDDVAGLRIDRDRAARARPAHAFHGIDEGFAADAVGLLQAFVEEVHA